MPNIKPISELKNYTSILNEAKTSIRDEGTISADELEKELGL